MAIDVDKFNGQQLSWIYLNINRDWLFPYQTSKQDIWMVLSSFFVSELMTNAHALILLARMEHHIHPEKVILKLIKMYYSTFIKSGFTKEKFIYSETTWVTKN
jgi:hypothetical protein